MKIVLASNNRGKLAELQSMFAPLGVELICQGDLFEGEGMFSRVHVINRSAKTVNITAGGTVGCEYNIATRTNFKLPRRFDLAFAIPVWVVE